MLDNDHDTLIAAQDEKKEHAKMHHRGLTNEGL